MNKLIRRFARNESGATAIEYGLIAAFMAVCLIGALPSITSALSTKFGSIGTSITSGTAGH